MHTYTADELKTLQALAEAKGVPGELLFHDFVPDGAEDEEDIVSVVARRFAPAEYAAWVDAPDTMTTARNACLGIVLSIEGAAPPLSGRLSIGWLGDLLDGSLASILRASARPLGHYPNDEDVNTLRLGRKTLPAEIDAFGVSSAAAIELRRVYPDPGQLRAVKAGEAPPFILRRPTLDEYAALGKVGWKQAGLVELLLDCIVEPAPIEQRRAIVERWPGLGSTCVPILQAMRSAGAAIEKKGRPLGGRTSGT